MIHGQRWYEICDVVWDNAEGPHHEQIYIIKNNVELIHSQPCVIFCKMNFMDQMFNLLQSSPYNHILISNNSDYPVTQQWVDILPHNIKTWYAVNLVVKDDRLIHIPIGLERALGGGISSDYTQVEKNIGKTKTKLVYMNHSDRNNMSVRKPITHKFSNVDWVTHDEQVSYADYMSHLSDHKFTLSPNGYGIDCHRTWEALYVGTIPILNDSLLAREFAKHLPILIVDDMLSITEEFLNNVYEDFNKKEYDLSLLSFDYWKTTILNNFKEWCTVN